MVIKRKNSSRRKVNSRGREINRRNSKRKSINKKSPDGSITSNNIKIVNNIIDTLWFVLQMETWTTDIDLHKYIPNNLLLSLSGYMSLYRETRGKYTNRKINFFAKYYDRIRNNLILFADRLRSIQRFSTKFKIFRLNLMRKLAPLYNSLSRYPIKSVPPRSCVIIDEEV